MPSFHGILLFRKPYEWLIGFDDLGLDNAVWLPAAVIKFTQDKLDPSQPNNGLGWGTFEMPDQFAEARPRYFARDLLEVERQRKAERGENKRREQVGVAQRQARAHAAAVKKQARKPSPDQGNLI